MKQRFFILSIIFLFVTNVIGQTTLDDDDYYIEGDIVPHITTINGVKTYVYTLENVTSNGIYFTSKNIIDAENIPGVENAHNYRFENARTDCENGFSKGFELYGKHPFGWQYESEKAEAKQMMSNTKTMAIVLVLDCSSSIGDNFSDVKRSAKSFIQTLGKASSYHGNIHIGLIGFNDKVYSLPIMPLNNSNEYKMLNFIDGFSMSKNTTAFKAMDESIDMLNSYVQSNLNNGNFETPMICTFTDGMDNASKDANKEIPNPTAYFNYLNKRIHEERIGNKNIRSWVIYVPGDSSEEDKIVKIFSQLASSKSDFEKVRNYSELNEKFKILANQLVDNWQDLVCRIPDGVGQDGHFRLVLNCDKPVYTIKFIVDGEVYNRQNLHAGDPVKTPSNPTKYGYTFNGWAQTIPSIMPKYDVTITGSFKKIPTYTLKFVVDGRIYEQQELKAGERIIKPDEPTKSGYYFNGWNPEVPSVMPSKDLTITGYFSEKLTCADYERSIGVVFGTLNGVIYKSHSWDSNFSFQFDIGKDVYNDQGYMSTNFSMNLNLDYWWSGALYWDVIGFGCNMGWNFSRDEVKLGFNYFTGLEWVCRNLPFAFGWDIRPGYSWFMDGDDFYGDFDFCTAFNVRFTW